MKYLILSFIIITVSCGKPVSEVNPDYLGTWQSIAGTDDIIVLDINSSGQSNYKKQSGTISDTQSGTAKIIGEEEKLKVSSKRFTIEVPPYSDSVDNNEDGSFDDLEWFMVLDGITFRRN